MRCSECGKQRETKFGLCWPCAKLPKNARRIYTRAVDALEVEAARQLRDVFDPERKLSYKQLLEETEL